MSDADQGGFWDDHARDIREAEYRDEFERQLGRGSHTDHCLANVLWDACDCPISPAARAEEATE